VAESKVRAALRELVVDGVPPASLAGLDPSLVARVADEQGLAGLLLAALESVVGPAAAPWTVLMAPLESRRRLRLANGVAQVAFAARALRHLEARAIRALPLKGVALVETVYDLESDRPMADVDLLVLERWPAAIEALAASGLDEVTRADHASVLRERSSGLLLELHRSLTSAPGLFALDPDGSWQRRRAGVRQLPWLPSPEDLLVQLALHAAFQHALVLTLVQWLDFRRLLEREALDVELAWSLAAALRAEPALAAALLAAHAVTRMPLVEQVRERATAALPRGLRRWLLPRLTTPLLFVEGPPQVARVRLLLLAGRRLELLRRTLLLPETPEGDTRLLPRAGHACARLWRFASAR
jgi:hypothetical protein